MYADTGFDMSTAAGGSYLAERVMRGNSAYDPDYTGVGSQPYGFDELTAVYHSYRVLSSKISVYVYTTTAATTTPKINLFLWPDVVSATPTYTDPSDLRALHNCKNITFNFESQNAQGGKKKLSHYCSTRKLYPGLSMRDADWTAAFNENPTKQWYWHVLTDTSDVAADTTIKMDIKVVYYIQLSRYRDLNES